MIQCVRKRIVFSLFRWMCELCNRTTAMKASISMEQDGMLFVMEYLRCGFHAFNSQVYLELRMIWKSREREHNVSEHDAELVMPNLLYTIFETGGHLLASGIGTKECLNASIRYIFWKWTNSVNGFGMGPASSIAGIFVTLVVPLCSGKTMEQFALNFQFQDMDHIKSFSI